MSDAEHSKLLDALQASSQGPSPADIRILERCRDIAVGSLSGTLKGMLDRLSDEFFAHAEKAVQLDTQHLYLEAMTIARDKRATIEDGFRLHFIHGFNSVVGNDSTQQKKSSFEDEADFGLVSPDDLEVSIARQEMAAKLKGNCRDELFALDKRMAVLLHDEELERHPNPLGAEVLADAFMAACGDTEATLKARLLFVTMWDKHMQNGVLSLYHEINQYLVEKNILPKIKREIKRQGMSNVAHVAAAAAQAAVEAMGFDDDAGEVFQTMQHLFSAAAARGNLPGMGGVPGMPGMMSGNYMPAPGMSGTPGTSGTMWSNAEMAQAGVALAHNPMVLTQLTQLQHGDAALSGGGVAGEGGALLVGNMGILRELKNSDLGASLGSLDAMTIDIVAMLFDFIFEDKQVPDPIKALIGRLQIPVLKAAMLDQSFFSKKSHPTRRLLNALADAATGWGEVISHESPLYQKVEAIVLRVNEAFEDNLSVFEDALDEFERFIEEQDHGSDALVEVSIDMIEAREREQIKEDDAQQVAESAVRARAADIEVPDTVRLFLCQEWIKPLCAAYLNGSNEGHAWIEAVGLMDDLIWSVRPKLTRESRQYMVKTLPGLLRRLQQGMDRAEITQAARDQFMSQLVHCHAAAVKAGFQPPLEPQIVSDEAWKIAARARHAFGQEGAKESAVVLPFVRPESMKAKGEVKLEIIRAPANDSRLIVEEITIAGTGWIEQEELDAQSDALMPLDILQQTETVDESAAKHLVAELRPGTWVEFRHADEEKMQAKLKWISPLKSAYLFTDRQGKRAATMPLEKLEAAFRIGSARIIDELPLLDRAVDNVLEALKQAAA
jgi:exonuclease VII small subunit